MTELYNNINKLTSVMEEEFALYETLLGMTINQKKAAEAGDAYKTIKILRERVTVIARIDVLSAKAKDLSKDKQWRNKRVSDLAVSINKIISKIIKYDSETQAVLSENLKATEERLAEVSSGLRKVKCMPKGSAPPRFISLKL